MKTMKFSAFETLFIHVLEEKKSFTDIYREACKMAALAGEEELNKLDEKCKSICEEVTRKIDELPHIEIAKYEKKEEVYLDDVKNFMNVVVNKSKEVFASDECKKLVKDTKDGVLNVLEKGLDTIKDILETK